MAANPAIDSIRFGLVAAWTGAAIFFSATVAPAAFGVLRGAQVPNADEWAGAIVSRVLGVVNLSGFVVALLALLLGLALRQESKRGLFIMETVLLSLVALTTGAGQWIIDARMKALRAVAGRPLAELAKTDAVRVAFDQLHSYSVIVLSIGMLAALAALGVMAVRRV